MAKISFYLGEILGRMGGVVFSVNKAGNYIKPFTKQNNPKTKLQGQQRTQFAGLATAWAQLEETQRQAWRSTTTQVYDRFGVLRTLKGRQLYFALNRPLQVIGVSILEDVPLNLVAPAQFANAVTLDASSVLPPPELWEGCNEILLNWDEAAIPNMRVVLYATRPLNLTIVNPGHQLTYLSNEVIDTEFIAVQNYYYPKYGERLASVYNNKFIIHVSVFIIDVTNGKTSAPITGSVIYGQTKQLYP
jgi:hypothetical protein